VTVILAGVKLPEWARIGGVGRQSATGWFHDGVLLVPARQLAAGAILVDVPAQTAAGVGFCARVFSFGQRSDLDRQVARLAEYLTAQGIAPSKVVSEVGSGRSGHRARLLALLRDALVGTIVVEHRERVARFGVGYLGAALAAQGRRLIVAGRAEVSGDLVWDMVEVLTSFCARLYGRRSARQGAGLALAAACGAEAA
jgi:putative resolvase